MNQKKKLIIFSYDFPPSNGGIARLCQEIAVGMRPYYESVKVLTRKKLGVNVPYNLEEAEVVLLPNKRLICELAALKYLSKLKDKNDYTIICGTWHPEATLSLFAGFKNVFILGHGTELIGGNSFFRKNIWLRYYAKFVLNNVKLTIANSSYTRNLVKKISESANSVALPLGVNHVFFKPLFKVSEDNNIIKICTVSRIEQFKGHDFIASVLAKLPENFRNQIEWNVAGTGEYLPELEKIISNLGIENIVKFHGFVNDNDLPVFYNNNDLFILCSRENRNNIYVEGFGLVFLEAQSCGIPVIGTNTGGIADAISNGNGGWLIDQDNTKELYDIIEAILKNKSVAKSMGERARNRVLEGFTWEIYCQRLDKLINLNF